MTVRLAPSARRPALRGDAEALPRRSLPLLALFNFYARRYLARHLHAVRVSRAGGVPTHLRGPVLVVLNHPSWWDPLVCQLLLQSFPTYAHYAPIDAAALGRYRFFERLGYFGIEPGTLQGAAKFLRVGTAVLRRPDGMLWVTAQGTFTDVRTRPAGLRAGVGHLAHRLDRGLVLPLALEYSFWEERTPEALVRFGEPLRIDGGTERDARGWTRLIERSLEATQDALAYEACRRDPAAFDVLLAGRAGVGGVYDLWRSLKARLRGERFRAAHGAPASPGAGGSAC